MQQGGLRGAPIRVALRRGLVLTCVLALLGAVAGATYGWYRERNASAHATILVNPLDGNPFSTSGRGDNLTNMETEAQLVGSQDVLERVAGSEGVGRSAEELVSGLDVAVPANTQLIDIRFRSPDEAEAVQLAQAFATSFLAFREDRARSLVDSQVKSIEGQLEDRKAERAELTKNLSRAKGSESASLQAQIASINTQLDSLRSRIVELRIGPFNPGMIVTPAVVDDGTSLASWLVFGAIGMAAGLLASLVIALVRARSDTRVHHVEDIELSDRSLLAQVSLAETDRGFVHLTTMGSSGWSVSTGLQEVRVSVLTIDHRRPLVLLVASGSDDGGRAPLTVAGLALSLGSAGLRTILVDAVGAYGESPAAGRMPSLVEVLSGAKAVAPSDEMLSIIPSGNLGEVEELLMGPALPRLIRTLKQRADIILVATGGVRHYRARALGDCVDGVITEIVEGVSLQEDTRLGSQALEAKDFGLVYVGGGSATTVPEARPGVNIDDTSQRHEDSWKGDSAVVTEERAGDDSIAVEATPDGVGDEISANGRDDREHDASNPDAERDAHPVKS